MSTKQTNLIPTIGLKIPIVDVKFLQYDSASEFHKSLIRYNATADSWSMADPAEGKGMFVFIENWFDEANHFTITGITPMGTACYAEALKL